MKKNKLGTLVELDPTKKYIMLLDADLIGIEECRQIAESKLMNGTIILASSIGEGVAFVENSDKIIEIVRDEKK